MYNFPKGPRRLPMWVLPAVALGLFLMLQFGGCALGDSFRSFSTGVFVKSSSHESSS